jgi:hypothetical protein
MIYPGVGLIFCLPMCFTFSPCLRDVKGQTGSLHVLIEEIGWEVRDFGLLIPFVKEKV